MRRLLLPPFLLALSAPAQVRELSTAVKELAAVTSSPPSGPAGGALSGTYPNPALGASLSYPGTSLTVGSATVQALTVGAAPTITPQTAGGGQSWSYKCVYLLSDGSHTEASAAGSTSDGALDLTVASHGNLVACPSILNYATIDYYRTSDPGGSTPSTTGKIGSTTAPTVTLLDNGLAGDGNPAPTTNTTGTVMPAMIKLPATATVCWVPAADLTAACDTTVSHVSVGYVSLNGAWLSAYRVIAPVVQVGANSAGYPFLSYTGADGILTVGNNNNTSDGGVQTAVFQMSSSTAPTCDSTTQGQLRYHAGGSGVKDSVQVCAKDATDTWTWRAIY